MSDLPSIDAVARVEKLEVENAALRAEIDHLKNPRREVPAKPVEREVMIVQPAPVSSFAMPSADEMTKLLDVVGRHFPALLSTAPRSAATIPSGAHNIASSSRQVFALSEI